MESTSQSRYLPVGLAIFSMLFGAGNLMYPIQVGLFSGDKNFYGLMGFLITAVLLPLIGIVVMILFDGDYKAFFYRLGKVPGFLMILASMLIIGPVIAIPRIVAVSHAMMGAFLPDMTPLVFAIIFLGITFLFTYKESKIIDVLGNFISPVLVASLLIIIVMGLFTVKQAIPATDTASNLFFNSMVIGYQTMDLLGAIFFSSIILTLLKRLLGQAHDIEGLKKLASFGFKAGLIGVGLLALVYVGLSYLSVYHGQGLQNLDPVLLFREISLRVMGQYGTIVVAIAVFFACLSTAIALAAVVGEFLQKAIFRKQISFVWSLVILLLLCLPLANYGSEIVLKIAAGPILYIGYPILITMTFCNIAYKLCGFKYIKVPTLLVGVLALACYINLI